MSAIQHLRQNYTVSQVASVLNLRAETIKTAMKSGALRSWQIGRRGWRFCTPDDVEAFAAARGLKVNWDALPELYTD